MIEYFDTWWEAFDVCRERNRPIVADVNGLQEKIFPSGHSELIKKAIHKPLHKED